MRHLRRILRMTNGDGVCVTSDPTPLTTARLSRTAISLTTTMMVSVTCNVCARTLVTTTTSTVSALQPYLSRQLPDVSNDGQEDIDGDDTATRVMTIAMATETLTMTRSPVTDPDLATDSIVDAGGCDKTASVKVITRRSTSIMTVTAVTLTSMMMRMAGLTSMRPIVVRSLTTQRAPQSTVTMMECVTPMTSATAMTRPAIPTMMTCVITSTPMMTETMSTQQQTGR